MNKNMSDIKYELVYANKKDKKEILAETEETNNISLQTDKTFYPEERSLFEENQNNFLISGDNLQILKILYQNTEPLIKNKIKEKVKLVYIDPPFGTGIRYNGNMGQNAYSAEKKDSDFIEFIRERVILLKELLSNNGFIIIRQAYNFGHYIKIILDETFGKENFVNEIIINRKRQSMGSRNKLETQTESLFVYAKGNGAKINTVYRKRSSADFKWTGFLKQEIRNPRKRVFFGKKMIPPPNQHFSLIQEKVNTLLNDNFLRLKCRECNSIYYYDKNEKKDKFIDYIFKSGTNKFKYTDITPDIPVYGVTKIENCLYCGKDNFKVEYLPSDNIKINNIWLDIPSYTDTTGYPTENSEALLERAIKLFSNEGDLVIDIFGGSGTTAVTAEKLNRRWLLCDIGKFSVYTIQKRLLDIENSKDLEKTNKKYGKKTKPFAILKIKQNKTDDVIKPQENEYINLAKNLFNIEPSDKPNINGIKIDGRYKQYYVKIFPHNQSRKIIIDKKYLETLHKNIKGKINDKFYIITPKNNINIESDYYQIDDIKYYFFKIPHNIIKELYKSQYENPKLNKNLKEIIDFNFIIPPETESEIEILNNDIILKIKKFISREPQDKNKKNFDNLGIILLDLNYNDKNFNITKHYIAKDMLKNNEIIIKLSKKECGNKIMAIYTDIYGNELREIFTL